MFTKEGLMQYKTITAARTFAVFGIWPSQSQGLYHYRSLQIVIKADNVAEQSEFIIIEFLSSSMKEFLLQD